MLNTIVPFSNESSKNFYSVSMACIGPTRRWNGDDVVTEIHEGINEIPVVYSVAGIRIESLSKPGIERHYFILHTCNEKYQRTQTGALGNSKIKFLPMKICFKRLSKSFMTKKLFSDLHCPLKVFHFFKDHIFPGSCPI